MPAAGRSLPTLSANGPMVHFGAAGSKVLVASLPCSCGVKAATDLPNETAGTAFQTLFENQVVGQICSPGSSLPPPGVAHASASPQRGKGSGGFIHRHLPGGLRPSAPYASIHPGQGMPWGSRRTADPTRDPGLDSLHGLPERVTNELISSL